MTDKTPLAEAIKTIAEEERRKSNAHFALAELKAYLEERTSEEETERIQDHLALCRQCSDQTLRLRRELATPLKRLAGAIRTTLWSPRFAYGIAIVFLVTAAGASLRLISLTPDGSPKPQLNVQYVALSLGATRSAEGFKPLETNAAHNFYALLTDADPSDQYGVEILRETSAGPELAWSTDQLRTMESEGAEYLSFVLPPGYLKPGTYAVKVFVLGEDRRLLSEDLFAVSENSVE